MLIILQSVAVCTQNVLNTKYKTNKPFYSSTELQEQISLHAIFHDWSLQGSLLTWTKCYCGVSQARKHSLSTTTALRQEWPV